jgi:arylsulfatase A-like enzyme
LALLGFTAGAGLFGCEAPSIEPPRNVVIVSADTLNRPALRAFDPAAEPLVHVDRFAASSVRFANAFTTASWTLPAHASVFTGLYPDRHGLTHWSRRLPEAVPTLAGALRERGFETVAFTGGGMMAGSLGLSHGFRRYDQGLVGTEAREGASLQGGAARLSSGEDPFVRAIAFLEGRSPTSPRFLLFVHSYVIHDYYMRYASQVTATRPPARAGGYFDCVHGAAVCSDREWEHLRERYAVGVRRFDAAFGRLLGAIAAGGLEGETLVILLSDHGEGFEPKRERIHHGGRLHADLVRIPLLMRIPGVPPGVFDPPVSLVDLAPTVLDWIGAPIPANLDGVSLRAAIRGTDAPDERALYAMEHTWWWENGSRRVLAQPSEAPLAIAVVEGDRWYIRDRAGEALYAVDGDPRQERDLSAAGSGLARARELARRNEPPVAAPETGAALGSAFEAQLRALGYLE